MEIEPRGVEGQVAGMAIGGLEVAGGVEGGGVPEAASEVGDQGEARPELGDLRDEDGVLVNRPQGVVEAVVPPLYDPRGAVDAQPLQLLRGLGVVLHLQRRRNIAGGSSDREEGDYLCRAES